MAIEPPNLDDRTFEQILREAQLRIPRYTPEWTDFNESDPGTTLLQLCAWLTESLAYRMNQVPERVLFKLLEVLDIRPDPPKAATAHLTFTSRPDVADNPVIPARSQVQASSVGPDGVPIVFETMEGIGLIRWPLEVVIAATAGGSLDTTAENNARPGMAAPPGWRPFGFAPRPDDALYLGFARPDNAPAPTGDVFPRELRLCVGLPIAAGAGRPQSARDAERPPAPPARLAWEYKPDALQDWRRLNVLKDGTAAFTREGYWIVEGPRAIDAVALPRLRVNPKPLYWLRCRVEGPNTYPPGQAPLIAFVRPNTVMAEHRSTVAGEVIGISEGTPGQRFGLQRAPVFSDTLAITVIDDQGRAEPWQRKDDLLGSGRDDLHVVLDASRGVVRFGDGVRGLIPGAGSRIVAQYRYGGGETGNVDAGQLTTMVSPPVGVDKVTNERRAVGGASEQSGQDLQRVASSRFRDRGRAVTADDYQKLAEGAGGVAKAAALAMAHPDFRGVQVPGAVTVVIVPQRDDVRDPNPSPSPDLISSVSRALNQQRLLTTELFVKGPRYHGIHVRARIGIRPSASFDQVARAVRAVLDDHLDPLGRRSDAATQAAGGDRPSNSASVRSDARQGWEIGEAFHPSRLYAEILGVDDVEAVINLEVIAAGLSHSQLDKPVCVPPDGLIYGTRDHEIEVEIAGRACEVQP